MEWMSGGRNADGKLSLEEAQGLTTYLMQMFAQMKTCRENLAQAESSFTMGVLMRGMEWMSGGVDEATFLARVVPAFREQIRSNSPQAYLQQAQQGLQQQQAAMQQLGWQCQ